MPTRPKKLAAASTTATPRLDRQPFRSDDHPPPPPSAPPVADPNQTPRRVNRSRTPASLVVRNTRASRNTSFYAPRYNHYLLARSFIKNDHSKKPRENRQISPSQLRGDAPPPDSIIPDFIWRFSAPHLDSKTRDAFAELKFCDPETFRELLAGLE